LKKRTLENPFTGENDELPFPLIYQLAFRTPGIRPWSANFRKQIRHVPNLRYTARGRPQSMHRCTFRVENFGGRFAAAIFDLLAILDSSAVGRKGP